MNPDEANLGGYVGFIFGGLGFAGTVWSYFFIPETKGRTVDEYVSFVFLLLFFACLLGSSWLRSSRLDWLYQLRVPARRFRTYQLYDRDKDKV